MKFGIYCNSFSQHNLEIIGVLIEKLELRSLSFVLSQRLSEAISQYSGPVFLENTALQNDIDVLITIGGDGTILNTIPLVVNSNTPILGINTGRLGFLTSINIEEMDLILDEISNNQHQIEERTMLEFDANKGLEEKFKMALNEIAVLKKDSSSMITIHTYLDGAFLNSYWADGLIISTPTGSTAYSLSCGGPIVSPGSGNITITPIAPHNLNVRPLVVPDTSEIKLKCAARTDELLISLDSLSEIISDDLEITIKKASSTIKLLRMKNYSYLETLRHKMNWGLDQRN